MKIRNLSKIALAIALSSGIVAQGCKKYDDDISRLEQSINQNTSDIAALKTQLGTLAATNVVQSVESVAGGFKITFKRPDGTTFSYDIVNGEKGDKGDAGSPGAVGASGAAGSAPLITIGENGNWWIANNGGAPVDSGVSAKGAKGDKGDPGQDGTNGQDGANGQDGTNGTNGQDGANGQDGTNGTNGQDGANGTNGTVVTIVTGSDGKMYWALDGQETTVQAYAGDIAMIAVDGGYNVVFTDAEGNQSDSIFLATEAVAVSSMVLVPTLSNSNTPIVFFPRIVDDLGQRTTLLQGYATITYNLNPFGVAVANYDATGLLTKETDEVTFRSGSGAAVNAGFQAVGQAEKTWGDITVKYRPVNANQLFPQGTGSGKNFHVALQVENHKAATNQKYAVSGFNVAKEEIVEQDEVTIEKAVKTTPESPYSLISGYDAHTFNGSSFVSVGNLTPNTNFSSTAAAANDAHFTLHINTNSQSGTAVELEQELRGFFARTQVGNTIVSMDDNGLSGYDLRFALANPNTTEANWLDLDPATGAIKVKESTPGHANTAALGNHTIVKVDLYASTASSTSIATRYVKVDYTQTTPAPVDVKGSIAYVLDANITQSQPVSWMAPNFTLDNAYNVTGKSASDFHNTYNFVFDAADVNVAGNYVLSTLNWFTPTGFDQGQNVAKEVVIDQTNVNPGTYRLKGRYVPVSQNSGDPVVNVEIAVQVNLTGNISYSPISAYWENNAARIYGKPSGSNSWQLAGDFDEYITLNSNIVGPGVTYKFVIPSAQHQAVAGFGATGATESSLKTYTSSVDGLGAEVFHIKSLNGAPVNPSAFSYVNGWTNNQNNTVNVEVHYYLNGNPVSFKSETIPVRFKNPVNALQIKNNGEGALTDKAGGNNDQLIDVRPFIRLVDRNGVELWNYVSATNNEYNTNLIQRYGVTGVSSSGGFLNTPRINVGALTFVEARYADDNTVVTALPQNTQEDVVAGTGLNASATYVRWRNTGANSITRPITLVYKVRLANKYNNGSHNLADIEQEIKITIQPNH